SPPQAWPRPSPEPSWRAPSSRRPLRSPSRPSQPSVDLLNLDEVSDGLDVTARLRVVRTDDRVADPLETEAAPRVALVLLLGHLETRGHHAPAFCSAAAAAFASLRTMICGTTWS